MLDFDQTKTYRPIEEKLAKTTNPRHRLLLSRLLQHSRGEVEGDLEAVVATLSPNPVYRSWNGPAVLSPEGMENVRKFYVEEIFGRGRHIFEGNKHRIVVDDETIITEGIMRIITWGRDASENGVPIDDEEACYLMTVRLLIVWPFDAAGYLLGEESYSTTQGAGLEKIAPEDVPQNFIDYIVSRQLAGGSQ